MSTEELNDKFSKPPIAFMGLINDRIKRAVPRKWTFAPQIDITTYELAQIQPFLGFANTMAMNSRDLEYLEHYNLLRHFLIEDAPEVLTASNKPV